ncbi:hypothetical protein A500_09825 [Clostridium sartagoforme AAU1]|uniref:Uncharacterized protein n=1 Tax=Clostridium sartagoforme AAU1 TaxID=1202534 RepID=R9C832_9CLOT|nr:hypothetical protein [Clostridium sartagoforme]EOR25539.1 hypothetical protein A500_09825 [Clostridium sartagoforme AAU1]
MNTELLCKISDGLNKIGCNWGIGGSVLLNYHGLIEKPNDIDILINSKDSEKVVEFMERIGSKVELSSKEPFKTESFFGYKVDGVMVEFMGNFKINLRGNKIYEFILDDKSIVDTLLLENSKINFTSLEDWFVAYIAMDDPKKRTPLIKEYFKINGLKHKDLLQRNLKRNLSEDINISIKEILSLD